MKPCPGYESDFSNEEVLFQRHVKKIHPRIFSVILAPK